MTKKKEDKEQKQKKAAPKAKTKTLPKKADAKPKEEAKPKEDAKEPAKKSTAKRNEKGQFVKGGDKPEGSGRKAGTKNKYGNIRDRLKEIIMPYLEPDPDNIIPGQKSLATDLMKIDDPNDRVHAVAAILPYIVPKYTSTTITADANRPISEEEHLMQLDAKYTKQEISINIKALTIVDNDNPDGDYDPDDDPDFNLDELK